MTPPPIKFDVPDDCRLFTPFPRLPPEIRQKIWETHLCDPGVSFVRLEPWNPRWRWGRPPLRSVAAAGGSGGSNAAADQQDAAAARVGEVGLVVKGEAKPRPSCFAKLVAISPNWKSDISRYTDIYRQMAILSMTCTESADLVRSLANRPGVLRLANGNGNIVTLDKSPDLVYLEYLPQDFYQTNCTLDVGIFCPGIDLIRRVAVRYSHSWRPKLSLPDCTDCGKPHNHDDQGYYPTHLYQFLARCLPNLDEFYFIDYFIVPRPEEERGDAMCLDEDEPRRTRAFRAKNRFFHDVTDCSTSDSDWMVDPKMRQVRDWLQGCFVRYAKASPLSQHKDPERVRFGILACEWNICAPTSHGPAPQKLKTPKTPSKPRTKPTHKGWSLSSRGPQGTAQSPLCMCGSFPHLCGGLYSLSNSGPAPVEDQPMEGYSAGGLASYQFGTNHLNNFKFTFSKLHGSVFRWTSL